MSSYNDPTHTYMDITIANNKIDPVDTNPIQIVFNCRRDGDYLTQPSDYYVSVVRWSLDCRLPIIVPQLVIGSTIQTDAISQYFNTVYQISISLKFGATIVFFSVPIKFRAETASAPPFTTITNLSDTYDNSYFYVDSVQWFQGLVNEGFRECWTGVKAAYVAAGGVAHFIDAPPQLIYNYDGTFNLLATTDFLSSQTIATGIGEIFFNSSLNTLFNGFSTYIQSLIEPNGRNYRLLFLDPTQATTLNNVNYVYSTTEYPVLPFWSPLSSIVFQSQGIPVEPTNTAPTTVVGGSIGALNNNANLAPVITDFDINFVTGTEGRSIMYYAVQGEYRFFDLNTNRPLAELNIIASWRDKIAGTLHPIYLFSGGGASLKLLFRKKNFYSQV